MVDKIKKIEKQLLRWLKEDGLIPRESKDSVFAPTYFAYQIDMPPFTNIYIYQPKSLKDRIIIAIDLRFNQQIIESFQSLDKDRKTDFLNNLIQSLLRFDDIQFFLKPKADDDFSGVFIEKANIFYEKLTKRNLSSILLTFFKACSIIVWLTQNYLGSNLPEGSRNITGAPMFTFNPQFVINTQSNANVQSNIQSIDNLLSFMQTLSISKDKLQQIESLVKEIDLESKNAKPDINKTWDKVKQIGLMSADASVIVIQWLKNLGLI